MLEYLFWPAALALLGMLVAADYVLNHFRHSARSRIVLAGEAAGAGALAVVAAEALGRPGRWAAVALWTAVLWLPLFVVAALVTVERWRRTKLRGFDVAIRGLRRELYERRAALDRLMWEIRDLERRSRPPGPAAAGPPPRRERTRGDLEAQLEAWERGGGLARVRALRVEHWRRELEGMEREAWEARRGDLRQEMDGASDDGDLRAACEAQLTLMRLMEIERGEVAAAAAEVPRRTPEPSPPGAGAASGGDAGLEEARRRQAEHERELARVQTELEQRQRQRAEFLRQRIPLD